MLCKNFLLIIMWSSARMVKRTFLHLTGRRTSFSITSARTALTAPALALLKTPPARFQLMSLLPRRLLYQLMTCISFPSTSIRVLRTSSHPSRMRRISARLLISFSVISSLRRRPSTCLPASCSGLPSFWSLAPSLSLSSLFPSVAAAAAATLLRASSQWSLTTLAREQKILI